MEESKITRQKAQEASAASGQDEDTSVLDNLLEKLRNGDTVGRRPRRARPSTSENRSAVPSSLNTDGIMASGANDTADIARDMLARLQSDGFQAFTPTAVIESTSRRQTRRRRAGNNLSTNGELDLASPEMGSESLPDIPLDHDWQMAESEAEET
jgi:cytokinesis protein